MIADNETNYLYLADTLSVKYPNFYTTFNQLLRANEIDFEILLGTKDVWAVDYMPIQVTENKFVRFIYKPSYLRSKEYQKTISNVDEICEKISLETQKSEIILDGGNVTKYKNVVVMTERIFKENPTITRHRLTEELESLFEVDKLIFIPEQPYDFTGHSDGMLRFIDDSNVLINDYSKEEGSFQKKLEEVLLNAGIAFERIPYSVYENTDDDSAVGDYINYLQMKDVIFLPVFNLKEDEVVHNLLETVFPSSKIVIIEASEIAKDGGVLNCISWNIRK